MLPRLLFLCIGLLSYVAFAQAEVGGIVLTLKEGGDNYANCDGAYVITSDEVNGRSVYVNEEKRRMIAWTGTRWMLTSTAYLDQILDAQGQFGGYHSTGSSSIGEGWANYRTFTTPWGYLYFSPLSADQLQDPEDYNKGDLGGTFKLSSEILFDRVVYRSLDGEKIIGTGVIRLNSLWKFWLAFPATEIENLLPLGPNDWPRNDYDETPASNPWEEGWHIYDAWGMNVCPFWDALCD